MVHVINVMQCLSINGLAQHMNIRRESNDYHPIKGKHETNCVRRVFCAQKLCRFIIFPFDIEKILRLPLGLTCSPDTFLNVQFLSQQ